MTGAKQLEITRPLEQSDWKRINDYRSKLGNTWKCYLC